MKKLIALLMIILFLVGCSSKKQEPKPASTTTDIPTIKPVESDPYEKIYGTWRTSAITTNGAKFDMEQIEALGGGNTFDMIFILNKDETFVAYSGYYNQTEEGEWSKGDNNSIIIGNMEFFMEDDEIVMTSNNGDKLYMEKLSDRQDKEYLEEIIDSETKQEESQPIEESGPEKTEDDSVSNNTLRPEVKEAIDAYESFIDEYCEFMTKYSNSDGTDMSLLIDYTKFISSLSEYQEKMDAMEDDLTDAEYWYYVEVLNRCNEKIMKAAY